MGTIQPKPSEPASISAHRRGVGRVSRKTGEALRDIGRKLNE